MVKSPLVRFIDNMSPEKQQAFKELVQSMHAGYLEVKKAESTGDKHSAIMSVYEEMDRLVKEHILTDAKISCKKGCYFCCSMHVDISPSEAGLLVDYAKAEGISIDWDKAAKQDVKGLDDWSELSSEERKCVFLSDQGECKVYQVRPMACRKYYVVSDPAICDTTHPEQEGEENVQIAVNLIVEALYGAVSATEPSCETMAKQLIKSRDESK